MNMQNYHQGYVLTPYGYGSYNMGHPAQHSSTEYNGANNPHQSYVHAQNQYRPKQSEEADPFYTNRQQVNHQNSNDFSDEEAKRRIAECDQQIKRLNEALGEKSEQPNWSKKQSYNKNGSYDDSTNHKFKKSTSSWKKKLQGDIEMSKRQKKKEFYGVGQAWAREDFFNRLPPAQCPFGMKMLKGMGWRHGQAIGRQKEGMLEPIVVDVRFGRQGLCTKEEKQKLNLGSSAKPAPVKKSHPISNINGKHPVSLLAEQCMKRHMEMPKYNVVFEYGSIHNKSVLVSVTVGGKTFEPTKPSPYKKHSKAAAAAIALKELGLETDIKKK